MNPEKVTCPKCHSEWYAWKPDSPVKPQVVVRERCSKCGSEDIQVSEPPIFEHDTELSVGMQCQDCGHKWAEYFDLVEVVEEDDVPEKVRHRKECPKCHHEDFDVHEIHRDEESMIEEVDCLHCGHTWTEHYLLKLEEINDDEDDDE